MTHPEIAQQSDGWKSYFKKSPEEERQQKLRKLQLAVSRNRTFRTSLINTLLIEAPSDLANRVRFLAMVTEYEEASDEPDRISKGEAIVKLFFGDEPQFPLTDIPQDVETRLLKQELEVLSSLRHEFTSQLVNHPIVAQAISKV